MPSVKPFSIIVATSNDGGIGAKGNLPWRLPGDMAFFKRVTVDSGEDGKLNAVIMGRKTWDSIPPAHRPLPDRLNIVLTRDPSSVQLPDGVICSTSLNSALETASGRNDVAKCFVIGGGQIYKEALELPECDKIYRTLVHGNFDCDTFFPSIPAAFTRDTSNEALNSIKEDKGIKYEFQLFAKASALNSGPPLAKVANNAKHEEYQYLDLISDILDNGVRKGDRTGTGTISKFGAQMRFNLRESFPLLTTKRVFWRGVAEELLWFVSGSTNANLLKEKDIHIWDGNGSVEFLSKLGLGHREEGDLGPVYGFQWRHFGAKYTDMHADYTGQGVDQLAQVIHTIKTNPNDRRILLSAWNPADLGIMALPPCHMFCQFYVDTEKGELSCQMYQRSCDMGLGVPFNIASYALLTCMVAQVCDLKPGDFVHCLGDAHVYSNHVDALKVQLEREPRPFPKLTINPDVKDIDGFKYGDFTITGYEPHAKIAMDMAV